MEVQQDGISLARQAKREDFAEPVRSASYQCKGEGRR
jgi:hypothetical protein